MSKGRTFWEPMFLFILFFLRHLRELFFPGSVKYWKLNGKIGINSWSVEREYHLDPFIKIFLFKSAFFSRGLLFTFYFDQLRTDSGPHLIAHDQNLFQISRLQLLAARCGRRSFFTSSSLRMSLIFFFLFSEFSSSYT